MRKSRLLRVEVVNNSDLAAEFIQAFAAKGKRGVTRAVNRAVNGVRTDGGKLIREDYNVKAGVIHKSFRVQRAGGGALKGAAIASGSRIPLLAFGARPAKPGGRRPKKGVSVKVKSTRKTVRGSFVAGMKSGHVGVFMREGKARFPIREKFSYAVPEMLNRPEKVKTIEANAVRRFDKNLAHEIDYAFRKFGVR